MFKLEVELTDQEEEKLLEKARKEVKESEKWNYYKEILEREDIDIARVIMEDMNLQDRYEKVMKKSKELIYDKDELIIALYSLLHKRFYH